MTRLIVNADDLGLTRGVNDGIIDAHSRGIVTSASLMVLTAAAPHAIRAAARCPELSLGLHFAEDQLEILDDRHALARAFATQVERFLELTGRDPTHVDSHHHVHMPRLAEFAALVAPLGVPLRGDGHAVYVGDFYGEPDVESVSSARLLEVLQAHADEELVELGCHPAVVTDELRSSYREPRAAELRTLTEPGLAERLHEYGFALTGFGA